MTATDIDLVMTEGLGRRYAFMGVLETAYLNAHGNRSICIYLFLLTYKESICMVIWSSVFRKRPPEYMGVWESRFRSWIFVYFLYYGVSLYNSCMVFRCLWQILIIFFRDITFVCLTSEHCQQPLKNRIVVPLLLSLVHYPLEIKLLLPYFWVLPTTP